MNCSNLMTVDLCHTLAKILELTRIKNLLLSQLDLKLKSQTKQHPCRQHCVPPDYYCPETGLSIVQHICFIHRTARFTWRCVLYSTACDNGGSFSLSYTRNKASKMLSTINQLKHGKGRAVRTIMVLGVVSIDHTALSYASSCMAISTTPLVPLLGIQPYFPCFN